MQATTIPNVNWEEDPRLVVGWRQGRSIEGARVSLDSSTFADIREIAESAIDRLTSSSARIYEPFAELEDGEEYFEIPVADLPSIPAKPSLSKPPPPADGEAAAAPETAGLLAITSDPDGLRRVAARDLDRSSYLFYGLVFTTMDDATATFVRKADPVKQARSGRINLSGRDALHRAEPPALTLLHDIDLVATASHLLALRKSAVDQLLNDVRIALQDAPQNVASTAAALAGKVELTSRATAALEAAAAKRPSLAVRMRALPDRIAAIELTADRVRERLKAMGNEDADLLDGDNFDFPQARVSLFMDLVEGRHFDDEWTGDRMRADRMSRHKP